MVQGVWGGHVKTEYVFYNYDRVDTTHMISAIHWKIILCEIRAQFLQITTRFLFSYISLKSPSVLSLKHRFSQKQQWRQFEKNTTSSTEKEGKKKCNNTVSSKRTKMMMRSFGSVGGSDPEHRTQPGPSPRAPSPSPPDTTAAAARQWSSPTDLTIQARLLYTCACVQAGPARHVAKPCACTHHAHNII